MQTVHFIAYRGQWHPLILSVAITGSTTRDQRHIVNQQIFSHMSATFHNTWQQ